MLVEEESPQRRWRLTRIIAAVILFISGLTVYDSWSQLRSTFKAVGAEFKEITIETTIEETIPFAEQNGLTETNISSISEEATLIHEQELPDSAPQRNFTFPSFWDFFEGPRPKPWTSNSSWGVVDLENYYLQPDKEFFSGTRKSPATAATYAAAWLSSKETFVDNPKYGEDCAELEKSANLEFGHFSAVRSGRQTIQTNDMLDYFVHHLSNYRKILGHTHKTLENDIVRLSHMMEQGYELHGSYNNPSGDRNGNVLCILPYWTKPPDVKSQKGPLTSSDHRRMFLRLTIKTLANIFPNIVISVSEQHDFDYVMNESGLNQYLYDVHFVHNLTRPVALPLVTSCQTRQMLLDGTYDPQFEFVYFTETDQILQLRDVHAILAGATRKNAVMVPWRGLPVPLENEFHEFQPARQGQKDLLKLSSGMVLHKIDDLRAASCCYSMNATMGSSLNDVALMQQHESFAHVAGVGNLHKMVFRGCEVRKPRQKCDSTDMA